MRACPRSRRRPAEHTSARDDAPEEVSRWPGPSSGRTHGIAWRDRPEALTAPLLAELVALAAALPFWLAGPTWPVLLLAGVALGGQSVVGLRLRNSTTYMTGVLTTGAHGLATRGDWRGALAAVRQLLALVVGAVSAALFLTTARWAALVLPLVLVAAAVLLVRSESPTRSA